jgi:osmotically-inducible protein OsmY
LSDLCLRQDILHELKYAPSVDAENIGVAVSDGIVTLTGYVGSYAEKVMAERVVRRVRGVRAVVQEIEVRLPSSIKITDDQIARRAIKIIAWYTTIPNEKVQVKVQNGWITLSGEVEWHCQKVGAEQAVRKLSGVAGVTNLIKVKPCAEVSDVKHRIEESFRRSAEVDAGRIHITVTGGKVTLEGTVHARHEKELAQEAAWSARGVAEIEDHVMIN